MRERVAENLNRGLHQLFAANPNAYLLGEDVLDPYGGAFKVTRGLSEAYPDRVLTTPLSENAIVGVANGLALRGNTVVVEIMFGDFLLLAMDQLVNFAAKSVSMYGRRVRLPVLVRCPVGGNRGYGATHSQSVQKFVVGVPDLELWELSPFVEADYLLEQVTASGRPSVLFEDKVLYTRRMFDAGAIDGEWAYANVGDPLWTLAQPRAAGDSEVLIVGAGGVAHTCLAAARVLGDEHGLRAEVAVPTRLQPIDPGPILARAASARRVVIVEEGTPHGSWGGVLAHRLHNDLWDQLTTPVELITSRESIIPAAAHLERQVLVSAADIVQRVIASGPDRARRPRPASVATSVGAQISEQPTRSSAAAAQPFDEAAADSSEAASVPLVMPRLNTNDEAAVLLEWLAADGSTVAAGEPVALVETSKATTELAAPASGRLDHRAAAEAEYGFGHVLATVDGPTMGADRPGYVDPTPPDGSGPVGSALPVGTPLVRRRSRDVQHAVAAAVSRSHRLKPTAFAAVTVPVDTALDHLDRLADEHDRSIDFASLLLACVMSLHDNHRALFAVVDDEEGTSAPVSKADVAITVDAGTGLFLPVVRADWRRVEDVADRVVELQMAALAHELLEADLDTRQIGMGVSLNLSSGVDVVQPLVMPGMSCMVSVGQVHQRCGPDRTDTAQPNRVVTLGIAHDHRVVNGRPAMEFLSDLARRLQCPAEITER